MKIKYSHRIKKLKPDKQGTLFQPNDVTNFHDESTCPTVTLITPRISSDAHCELLKYQFKEFTYPKDKLEWVIIDTSRSRLDMFCDDPRIRYNYWPNSDKTIEQCREFALRLCTGEYLFMFDENALYAADEIIIKIGAMLKTKKNLVASENYRVLTSEKRGYVYCDIDTSIIACSRAFYTKQKFDNLQAALENNLKSIVMIPTDFNSVLLKPTVDADLAAYEITAMRDRAGQKVEFFDHSFNEPVRNLLMKVLE